MIKFNPPGKNFTAMHELDVSQPTNHNLMFITKSLKWQTFTAYKGFFKLELSLFKLPLPTPSSTESLSHHKDAELTLLLLAFAGDFRSCLIFSVSSSDENDCAEKNNIKTCL